MSVVVQNLEPIALTGDWFFGIMHMSRATFQTLDDVCRPGSRCRMETLWSADLKIPEGGQVRTEAACLNIDGGIIHRTEDDEPRRDSTGMNRGATAVFPGVDWRTQSSAVIDT